VTRRFYVVRVSMEQSVFPLLASIIMYVRNEIGCYTCVNMHIYAES